MGHAQQLEKYYKQLNKKKQSQKASNKYMNSLTPRFQKKKKRMP